MTERKPHGWWRRLTDGTGLTEPGKAAAPMRPRFAAFYTVIFSLLGIGWLFQAGLSDSGQSRYFYLIFGVIFLMVAAGYFLVWKRNRRSPPVDKS